MKKTIALLMSAFLIVCLFAGCGSNAANKPAQTEAPAASAAPEAASSGTRVITDALGREVEIPAVVEAIVPLGNAPRMIVYLGLADKVVGISGFDAETITPLQAYAYACKDMWAQLPVVGTDSYGATNYYPEEIIGADPDVILCTYTAELAEEIQTQTGIPVVVVPMGTLFGEDYEQALRILGDVCGVSDRAEEVISYINGCLDDLAARTADVPDENKPTVLGAAATFKGTHGIEGVYTKYAVFTAIAANDVTAGFSETSGGVIVDKEQIIGWNPQYIFFDSGGVPLVQTDYDENPDYYAHLTAVSDGNLYQYPSSTCYYSNVEVPIVNSYYVASLLYPEQFGDIIFEEKANEIFSFFLGVDDYLSVLNDSGCGYGQVSLGAD